MRAGALEGSEMAVGVLVDAFLVRREGRVMAEQRVGGVVLGVLERLGKEVLGVAERSGGACREVRFSLSREEGAVWREVAAEVARKGYRAEVVVWYREGEVPAMVRVGW